MSTRHSRTKPVLGWHWLPADMRLDYGDGRLVVPGEALSVPTDRRHGGLPGIWLCRNGLHASRRLLDSLWYANNSTPVLCRVELWGHTHEARGDKLAAEHRRVLWMVYAHQSEFNAIVRRMQQEGRTNAQIERALAAHARGLRAAQA